MLLTSINKEMRQLQAAIPTSVSLKIKSGNVANWEKITLILYKSIPDQDFS